MHVVSVEGAVISESGEAVLHHPLAKGDVCQPSFIGLLKVPDSPKKPSKYDQWIKFLQETKAEEISLLAKRRSPNFDADQQRQTVHVDTTVYLEEKISQDPDLVSAMDDQFVKQLAIATELKPRFDLRDLFRLRYLVQDLMNQSLFAIDPLFLGQYAEKYSKQKQLIVSLNYDGALLKIACKNPYIALNAEAGNFSITAVQYWKVVSAANPEMIEGFDALRVQLLFQIKSINTDLLLLSPNCGSLSILFHGFRPTLHEISY